MKARLTTLAALVVTPMLVTTAPAFADGPALSDGTPSLKLQVANGSTGTASSITHRVMSVGVDVAFPDGRTAQVGTSYAIKVYSCGALIKEVTQAVIAGDYDLHPYVGLSPDGRPDSTPNPVNNLVGDNAVVMSVAITEPGYAPYMLTNTITYTGVGGPSCAEVLNPTSEPEDTSITVTKWSAKRGVTTARIGRRLSVTPTRAPGARVAYAWTIGKTVVDKDRSLTVKKTYRGKKVTLRVTVSKATSTSQSKTIRYGRAR